MPASVTFLSDVTGSSRWDGIVALTSVPVDERPLASVRLTGWDSLRTVEADDLAVMTEPCRRDDARLDVVVRLLADVGAAGIVLPGVEPLLAGTRRLVEKFELAVFGAEDVLAAALAAGRVVDEPYVGVADLLGRALDAFVRSGAAPRQVAEQILDRPVALIGDDGAYISGPMLPPGLLPNAPARRRQLVHSSGTSWLLVPTASDPGADGTHSDLPNTWLVTALEEGERQRVEAIAAVLELAATHLRATTAEHRIAAERDARVRSGLLAELERSGASPDAALSERLVDAGWRLDGWNVAFRVGLLDASTDVLPSIEPAALLASDGFDVQVLVELDGWIGWTSFSGEPEAAEMERYVAAVKRLQRTLDRWAGTHTGVGRAYPGPAGLLTSLAEARDASRLAANRRELGRFLHIDQLGATQLLLAWTQTDTFQPAAHALLDPLREAQGDLLVTLSTYLDAESSIAETAAVLGVHRNTVALRIERIRQLLGVTLDGVDERLALHLACRTVLGARPAQTGTSRRGARAEP